MSVCNDTSVPPARAMAGPNGGGIVSVVRSVFCSSMFSFVKRRISSCSYELAATGGAASLAWEGL